jgi:hypothetical protein
MRSRRHKKSAFGVTISPSADNLPLTEVLPKAKKAYSCVQRCRKEFGLVVIVDGDLPKEPELSPFLYL